MWRKDIDMMVTMAVEVQGVRRTRKRRLLPFASTDG
jgi:hypothetical protein